MQLQQQQQQQAQAQEQQRQLHQIRQQAAAAALQQGNFQTQALQRLSQQGLGPNQGSTMNMPQNLGMMNANQASAAAGIGQGGSGTGVGPMTPGQQQRVQQAIAAQVGPGQGAGSSPSMMSVDSPSGISGPIAEVALQRIEGIDAEKRSKVFEVGGAELLAELLTVRMTTDRVFWCRIITSAIPICDISPISRRLDAPRFWLRYAIARCLSQGRSLIANVIASGYRNLPRTFQRRRA